MSLASLREELLRELAVVALADSHDWKPTGAGSDLINWMSGPTNVLQRAWVFNDRGPSLIVRHVTHGSRVWFAKGVLKGDVHGVLDVVVTDTVQRTDDTDGLSRICVGWDGVLFSPFMAQHSAHFFLQNVLTGHIQDP